MCLASCKKPTHLVFLLEDRREEKTALSWRLAFAQIKPAKINLSLFGRWFQLNGGPCGLGMRAHDLGKPDRLEGLYDRFEGKRATRGHV